MKRHSIYNVTEAKDWQDATPVGNGTNAALVFGGISHDKILLNNEEWWYKQETKPLEDISCLLPEVKRLFASGEYKKAQNLYSEKIIETRWFGSAALYQPGISLNVYLKTEGEPFDYKRVLDMSSGVCTVSWTENGVRFEKSCFASNANGLIVYKLSSERKITGKIDLSLFNEENACGIFGEPFKHGISGRVRKEGEFVFFSGERGDGKRSKETVLSLGYKEKVKKFGAVAHVVGGTPDFSGVNEVLILVALYDGENEKEAKILTCMCDGDFDKLLSEHIASFSAVMNRVDFSLFTQTHRSNEELLLMAKCGNVSDELIEKLFFFGRYLLVISSGKNCLPPTLTGKWNGDYFPPWRGVFFLNENMQLILRQAYQGDLPEYLQSFFSLILSQTADYKENATKLFGKKGYLLPLYIEKDCGLIKDTQPHALFFIGGGGWVCQMMYDYWFFTGDDKFLKEKALPFMVGCLDFYEDYCITDGVFDCISNSPENKAIAEDGHKYDIARNSTFDVAIIKELASNIISAANGEEEYVEVIARCRRILSLLPEYRINEDGALAEWTDERFSDNYEHRHISHLYPVFPAREIYEGKFFEAAGKALQKRREYGLKDQSGWSIVHMANAYAKLNDGENAYDLLRLAARHVTGVNLFGYHNNTENSGVTLDGEWCRHAPHQIDENCGFTAAVQEMLVSVDGDGKIALLRALPERWKRGKITGMKIPGGKADVEWDQETAELFVTYYSQNEIVFRIPEKYKSTISRRNKP